MANLLFIAFVLIIVYSVFNSLICQYRLSQFNKLGIIYDQMEFSLVKNETPINNNIVEYLSGFKIYLSNRGLADIQVMLAIRSLIPLDEVKKIEDSNIKIKTLLPQEMEVLEAEFEQTLQRIIILSALKFDFIFVLALEFLRKLANLKFPKTNVYNYIKYKIRSVTDEENIIGRYSNITTKLNLAV